MTPTDPTPPRGVSIVPETDQPLVDARQDGAIAHLRHRQLWVVVLSIVAAVRKRPGASAAGAAGLLALALAGDAGQLGELGTMAAVGVAGATALVDRAVRS